MLIEVLHRGTPEYTAVAWTGERVIGGAPHRARFGDAGQLATPSRLAKKIAPVAEQRVVVHWVPLADVKARRPPLARLLVAATRPSTLLGSLFPAALAMTAAGQRSLALLVAMTLVHVAINLVSEAADHVRGVDSLVRWGGSKIAPQGWLTARQLAWGGVLAGVVGGAIGLHAALFEIRSWPLLVVGAVIVAIGAQFRVPPLRLSRTILGELLLPLAAGPLLTWAVSAAVGGPRGWEPAALGALPALSLFLRRHLRNLRRLPDDRVIGERTWATRLGFTRSQLLAVVVAALLAAGPVVLAALGAAPWHFAAVALAAVPLFVVLRPVLRAYAPHAPPVSRAIAHLDPWLFAYALAAIAALLA